MEAFGRLIAVLWTVFCVIFLSVYSKEIVFRRQKNETVRSIVKEYASDVLEDGRVVSERKEAFLKELAGFGLFEVNVTVYERRRFDSENGRNFFYREREEVCAEMQLPSGSYVRVIVAEQEKGKTETFLYGAAGIITAGGRVP